MPDDQERTSTKRPPRIVLTTILREPPRTQRNVFAVIASEKPRTRSRRDPFAAINKPPRDE